jgi:transcriptional regulator with XRE-family HTH domain
MSTAFSTKEIFGQKLSVLMGDYDVTQTELAALLGVAQSAVSNYVRGERLPPLEESVKLARHFKVSLDFMLGWEKAQDKISMVTEVAEIFAEKFSEKPEEQQQFFSDYVVILQETRVAAETLHRKLEALELKTRLVLGKTAAPAVNPDVEKQISTRAQIGAAKVLAEAQQADAESGSSQTEQSTSDKSGAPGVPSPGNPGRRRTPAKPAPK